MTSPCIRTMHYFTVDFDEIEATEVTAFVDADTVVSPAREARAEIARLLGRSLTWAEGSDFYVEWLAALAAFWDTDEVLDWMWMGSSPLVIAVSINTPFWSELYAELVADELWWFARAEDKYAHENLLVALGQLI